MSVESKQPKVRIPISRRVWFFRQRFLPACVWVVAIGIVVLLSQQQTRRIDAVGVVEVREVAVAPLVDGTLRALSVDVFDRVEVGQELAVMDDTFVRAALITAEAELGRLRAEIDAHENQVLLDEETRDIDQLDDHRRFVLNEEQARIDYLDRLVQQETDKVNLQLLGVVLKRYETLLEENAVAQSTFDEVRLEHEALATTIRESEQVIAEAKKSLDEAEKRLSERDEQSQFYDLDESLKPLREAINVQAGLILELTERRKSLVLKAPLSGKVSAIFRRTGETILSGDPLLMISDHHSRRVIAYVNEDSVGEIVAGTQVELFSRRNPRDVHSAKVLKVNSKIEEIPIRLRRNPLIPQWGLSVLIGEIPTGAFYPGEALDLLFIVAIPK